MPILPFGLSMVLIIFSLFSWASKSLQTVTAVMKLKDTLWKKSYDKPRQHIKEKRHHFANKGLYSQSYGFLVVMYRCERWTIKKAEYRRIDAFELWCWRTLLSPLDCKEIQSAHPKGNES